MNILGITAFYHDSSAALICNGEIIAAVQEERISRIKHDSSFPIQSIISCLSIANLSLAQIDQVVFYEKPLLKLDRLIETYFSSNGLGFTFFYHTAPLWFKSKIFQKATITQHLLEINSKWNQVLKFSKHHLSHAASAFYPSPYEKALVLVNDGVGEWETSSVFAGDKTILLPLKSINYPDSIGLLYSAFTYYLGFKVNSGEYKVMGLAPYGKEIYAEKIFSELITLYRDGSYKLNMKYFSFSNKLKMINRSFEKLFKGKRRCENEPVTQFHMDIAASIQFVLGEVLIKMLCQLYKDFPYENLCLAGGVALNCVANKKIRECTPFSNIWIQPASSDAGASLGAALYAYYSEAGNTTNVTKMDDVFLGNSYSDIEIRDFLEHNLIRYIYIENQQELCSKVAEYIANKQIVGWYQGRSEFGPRALGNRSILADPREVEMQHIVNKKIKFRESFRPFAPAVLEENVKGWFDSSISDPYMVFTTKVKNEHLFKTENRKHFVNSNLFKMTRELPQITSRIGAVTHIDNSARVQTVNKKNNQLFHSLISEFYKITDIPVLLNTSFNLNKMPIVDSPLDAYECFLKTNIDVLVIKNFIIKKDINV